MLIRKLVYEHIPAEYVFDDTALEVRDIVVKYKRLWTALAVTVSIHCLFI